MDLTSNGNPDSLRPDYSPRLSVSAMLQAAGFALPTFKPTKIGVLQAVPEQIELVLMHGNVAHTITVNPGLMPGDFIVQERHVDPSYGATTLSWYSASGQNYLEYKTRIGSETLGTYVDPNDHRQIQKKSAAELAAFNSSYGDLLRLQNLLATGTPEAPSRYQAAEAEAVAGKVKGLLAAWAPLVAVAAKLLDPG